MSIFLTFCSVQQSKQLMPAMEFNRKVSNEKELCQSDFNRQCNIVFDTSGNFIMYSTMIGIKLVNLYTNKNMTVIGMLNITSLIHEFCTNCPHFTKCDLNNF